MKATFTATIEISPVEPYNFIVTVSKKFDGSYMPLEKKEFGDLVRAMNYIEDIMSGDLHPHLWSLYYERATD